jgi:hypothetical protein
MPFIRGKVTDGKGEPLLGATAGLWTYKNGGQYLGYGDISDLDGSFLFDFPPNAVDPTDPTKQVYLRISHIGKRPVVTSLDGHLIWDATEEQAADWSEDFPGHYDTTWELYDDITEIDEAVVYSDPEPGGSSAGNTPPKKDNSKLLWILLAAALIYKLSKRR